MGVNIKPLAEYVVAQQEEAETKTASGLYLPDKAAEKPKIAKVIAVGAKLKKLKLAIKLFMVAIATLISRLVVQNTC